MDPQIPGDGAAGNISLLQLFSAIMQQQLQGNGQLPGVNRSGSGTGNTDNTYSTVSTPTAFAANGTAPVGLWAPPVPPQLAQQLPMQVTNGSGDQHTQSYRRLSREERKHLTDQERKERIRTKNRLAQQRFRDRRKAKKEAAVRHFDDLSEELDRLQDENDALRDSEAIMAKLILIRSGIIQTLNAGRAARQQPTVGLRSSTTGTDGSGPSTSTDQEVKEEPQAGREGVVASNLRDAAVLASTSVDARQGPGPSQGLDPGGSATPGDVAMRDAQPWSLGIAAGVSREEEFRQEQILNLQQWLMEIRQLMEKAAALGFPPDVVENLERGVKRQLEAWGQVAATNPVNYGRMIGCLLPPRDSEIVGGRHSGLGTVAKATLLAVASGIDPPLLYELQKQQELFAATTSTASHTLTEWVRDVLPSLILCVGTSMDGPLSSLGTRHLLLGMASGRLEVVLNDIWNAVAGFGPRWSRVRWCRIQQFYGYFFILYRICPRSHMATDLKIFTHLFVYFRRLLAL